MKDILEWFKYEIELFWKLTFSESNFKGNTKLKVRFTWLPPLFKIHIIMILNLQIWINWDFDDIRHDPISSQVNSRSIDKIILPLDLMSKSNKKWKTANTFLFARKIISSFRGDLLLIKINSRSNGKHVGKNISSHPKFTPRESWGDESGKTWVQAHHTSGCFKS